MKLSWLAPVSTCCLFVAITSVASQQNIDRQLQASVIDARVQAAEILRQQAVNTRNLPKITRRRPFKTVQGILGGSSTTKFRSLAAFQQLLALKQTKAELRLSKQAITNAMPTMQPIITASDTRVTPDSQMTTVTTDASRARNVCPFPMNGPDNDCDPSFPYRSYDGTCNNLRRPLWGSATRPLARFLQPDYADGLDATRQAEFGRSLPGARDISRALFQEADLPSHVHTFMIVTFGQFVDHEMTRTAVSKIATDESGMGEVVDVTCGESGCSTEGPENIACDPIVVRNDDPDFGSMECLMFVRTQEVTQDDCRVGPREQLNQVTAYIDASTVYGEDIEIARELRDFSDPSRGRLRTSTHPFASDLRNLLPNRDNPDCRDVNETIQCFNAGDERVNEQIGLTAMHTAFHRMHNVVEEKLNDLNPQWDGNRLYQESRKIMAAALQKITYDEFLPTVLGPPATRRNGLNLLDTGYYNGYDENVNADCSNSFATAAFRFAHTLIGDFIRFINKFFTEQVDRRLSTLFRRPFQVYNTDQPGDSRSGIDAIVLGMLQMPSQQFDRFFTREVTAHLFAENPPDGPGTDLPAINIKRGRDHGLPSYNRFREWCGLSVANTVEDLVDIPDRVARIRIRQLYDDVRDMDLFTGGIQERNVPGGIVGPTFACIIGRQFFNSRAGDRFWFERNDTVTGFTTDQLTEIRKFSLAELLCLTLDDIDTIQPLVMLQPISDAFRTLGANAYDAYSLASLYGGGDNERRPCSEVVKVSLLPWRDIPDRPSTPSQPTVLGRGRNLQGSRARLRGV